MIYLMERDKLNAENDSLSTEKERLEKELLALSQSRNRELTETCDMARRTLTADELTNEMLLFFIDRVNVYSGMRVEIIYRFSDGTAPLYVGLNSPYFFSLCLTSANPPYNVCTVDFLPL